MRESTRAYIIGYSLPNDDLEVIHLLRRGLRDVPPEKITVVLLDPKPDMVQRYRTHFGNDVVFQTDGFENWARRIAARLETTSSPMPKTSVPRTVPAAV